MKAIKAFLHCKILISNHITGTPHALVHPQKELSRAFLKWMMVLKKGQSPTLPISLTHNPTKNFAEFAVGEMIHLKI